MAAKGNSQVPLCVCIRRCISVSTDVVRAVHMHAKTNYSLPPDACVGVRMCWYFSVTYRNFVAAPPGGHKCLRFAGERVVIPVIGYFSRAHMPNWDRTTHTCMHTYVYFHIVSLSILLPCTDLQGIRPEILHRIFPKTVLLQCVYVYSFWLSETPYSHARTHSIHASRCK